MDTNEEATIVWTSLLYDIPDRVGIAALHQCLRQKEFPPKPADIIRIAETMRKDKPPLAEAAWNEVSRNLNQYVKPEWSHPLIEKTVRTMGFLNLCLSTNGDYDRVQFMKIYNSYKEREREDHLNVISSQGASLLADHPACGAVAALAEKFDGREEKCS